MKSEQKSVIICGESFYYDGFVHYCALEREHKGLHVCMKCHRKFEFPIKQVLK